MLKVINGVQTSDLQIGDAVVHHLGDVYILRSVRPLPDSEYVELSWSERVDSRSTFETTAQPWNIWSAAIREEA